MENHGPEKFTTFKTFANHDGVNNERQHLLYCDNVFILCKEYQYCIRSLGATKAQMLMISSISIEY